MSPVEQHGRRIGAVARPFLEVTEGPARGGLVDVPAGGLVLGRSAAGPGELGGDSALSRRHARLVWTSDGVLAIEDLGSTNGTYVNGSPIAALRLLRPGDEVRVGATTLSLIGGEAGGEPTAVSSAGTAARSAVRDGGVIVHGGQHVEEGGIVAGRDVRVDYDVDASGLSTVLRARGLARLLIVVGLLAAFAGFGLFGYPIVKVLSEGLGSFGSEPSFAERPDFDATPWLPLGAALMFGGIVVGNIGMLMIRHDRRR